MKWFRRMGHQIYRELFWKELREQLRDAKINFGYCLLFLIEIIVEVVIIIATINLLFFEHKMLIGIFGLVVCVIIALVLRDNVRRLVPLGRKADQVATKEVRRRLHF